MTLHPKFITDENGLKLEAVLPIAEYEGLLEDLEGLAAIAERKDEPTIPWEAVKQDDNEIARRANALATLAKYRGRFKAGKFNRDECYDR